MFSGSKEQKRGLKCGVSWGRRVACELSEVRRPWASVDHCNVVDVSPNEMAEGLGKWVNLM